MRGLLSFLTDGEIEQIHEASLQILKKTGMKVPSEKVRKLLAENGAEVDGDIVKFPKAVIEEAIKKAPQEINLGARDPKCEQKIPVDVFPLMSTSGFSPLIDDFESGKRRYSTASDLKDFAIIADYLDTVDFFWPIVVPTDLPPAIQDFHSLVIALRNNRKHIQCSSVTEKTAQWHIRLAAAIVGGEDELRRRPIFSSINCALAPLTFDKNSSEAMVVLAKAGIPIAPMSMALGGTTAPATMAGILAMGNAEELASLVVIQSACPGAPMIYCSEVATADMRTGSICYEAPEFPLLCAGGGQLARFYKLPAFVADIAPKDQIPEPTPSVDKIEDMAEMQLNIVSRALLFMSHTDLTASFGSIDQAISASLVRLVLDAEAHEHTRAYFRQFEINDDTLALDIINQIGPGGYFLNIKHTAKHYKKEIWGKKLPRTFILDSKAEGSFTERAQAKIKEILAEHTAPVIEEALDEEMKQIIQAAEKDIMGE